MAEPSEIFQEDGAEGNKAHSPGRTTFAALYRRPIPLWGLGAAVALVAVSAWLWHRNSDSTPKRWNGQAQSEDRPCFKNLTTEPPSPEVECFHSPESEKEIQPRTLAWVDPHVAVYSTPAPPHLASSLRDLADHGQAEAIRFLEKDSGSKGGAWASLRNALDQSSTRAGESDPFRFDRVLIANVAKGLHSMPGDRMIWTRVLVQPINFLFAGYTVAATENETQKIASVEKTNSRKFSADLSATVPGMQEPKASLGPSSEHTVKTSSDITAQYEKLGVDILPSFMRIMRESETGGDAIGNTKVSVTVVTDPELIRRRYPGGPVSTPPERPVDLLVTRFDEDGTDKQPAGNKPAIDVLPQVPVPHCPLRARVWMLYEERRVDSGHQFYDEARQEVSLVRNAEDKQDVDIMIPDEVSPAVWSLRLLSCNGDSPCIEGDELKAQATPDGELDPSMWRRVVFTDYGVAVRLHHWLRIHRKNMPSIGYTFNYPGVNGTTYTSLKPVKIKDDECKAPATLSAMIRAYAKRVSARRQRGRKYANADR
jgi:hypothetical protein